MLSAAELQVRGKRAADEGRLKQARRLSLLALEREPEPDVRAELLLQIAIVEAETVGLGRGLELCRRAREVTPVSRRVSGHIHARMGLLAMRSGDLVESLKQFETAEPLLLDDDAALTGLLINRGNIALQRQDLDAAAADFNRAITITTSEIERAKAQHNLGYAEFLRGNLPQALALMKLASPVLDPLSPAWRAVNESDRAEVLSACGLPEQAAAALERAAQAFAQRQLRQSQAEAELARARILLARDPVAARTIARKASRRFWSRGSEDWALRADVVVVSAEVSLKRRAARNAAAELHDALLARHLRAEAKTVCLQAATSALDHGDVMVAAQWLRRARVRHSDPLDTRLLNGLTRARLAAAQGRRADAFSSLRAGLDELHEWLSTYGSLDLQSALVGRGRGLAAFGLELAIADGRASVVFEWFERARVLVSRVSPVRPPSDGEAAADLAELRRQQGAGADDESLRDRIRQRAWYTPAVGRSAQPVRLSQLQKSLNGDALVSFVLTGKEITALVVTSGSAKVIPLGAPGQLLALLPALNADLDMAASELPPPIASVVRHSLDDRLAAIDQHLIGPVSGLVGQRRVVIVPAGALAGVPWSLLPGLRGRPVTVARSATHWVTSRQESRSVVTAGFITGPGVPRAAEEVRRAARGWGQGAHRVAIDGSADVVNEVAASVDVLHIAAHGRHSADNPLFSGIELTGGPWFGYDIDQLPAVPSVVLLSACELGRSSVRGAEELVGMTTAWLHAGTRCVIASPVAVNDNLAGELLPLVHERIASGVPPAEALAAAMGEVDGLAAFACYGAGW